MTNCFALNGDTTYINRSVMVGLRSSFALASIALSSMRTMSVLESG